MNQDFKPEPRHVVAVVGAATAGSEIARLLASRGALVVVFEQNARPYGKIEDGLPRWHVKQRRDEYAEINNRLDHPNVEYVPMTPMGTGITFDELRTGWGLSAVVLAHGAWRDRPFPLGAADQYVGRGLIYQNPLIYWFNHYQERSYNGPRFKLGPGGIVIGGGLASIDVVKVLQVEMTLAALRQRGIDEDMVRLEREGIDAVLKNYQLSWSGLGIAPCKLFYRRRILDMPLSDIPPDAPPKRAEAMRQARAKVLEKAQRKYLFEFEDRRVPTGIIVEHEHLAGVEMSRTEVVEGKARTLSGTAEPVRAPFVVSSIGSIPEPIPGIPQRGEVYEYADATIGLLMDGATPVYAAGNVLTGKGNIKDSLDHATEVGTLVAERYLGIADDGSRAALAEGARQDAHQAGQQIAENLAPRPKLSAEEVAKILARARQRQKAVGYSGNYRAWIDSSTPPDLQ
jgi:NADPH-dependent glutamate synthase beta subunit-like oxidoreductase